MGVCVVDIDLLEIQKLDASLPRHLQRVFNSCFLKTGEVLQRISKNGSVIAATKSSI